MEAYQQQLDEDEYKGKQINTPITQCYALTNDSEKESMAEFYDQYQAELENTPRHKMIGDLNTKVVSANTNHDRAMGKKGCGSMNNNEERLLKTCLTYVLVMGGTLFQHLKFTSSPGAPTIEETKT